MEISVVIPTKNRKNDLLLAVNSISIQTIMPKELIIIDQSDNQLEINDLVEIKSKFKNKTELIYHHDTSINGLVAAKHHSLKLTSSDYISFLEDDVVIEVDYFEKAIMGFIINPKMKGCSGIVLNNAESGKYYSFLHKLSHLGIFNDIRPSIFTKYKNSKEINLINSNALSGGISIWSKEVFNNVKFDTLNNFHLLEDIDYSNRVYEFYSSELYINTAVRLVHNTSPLGREFNFIKNKRKAKEYIIFYKKFRHRYFSFFNILWLLFCLLLQSLYLSVLARNLSLFSGLLAGILEGLFTPLKFSTKHES